MCVCVCVRGGGGGGGGKWRDAQYSMTDPQSGVHTGLFGGGEEVGGALPQCHA